MADAKKRGGEGESLACERLEQEGWRVLERNWRHGHSEIDIIAQRGHTIAFIEVKTRSQNAYAPPAGAVTAGQRRRIILAAVAYLQERGLYNTGEYQPRFDVIEVVTLPGEPGRLLDYQHLENAYDAGGLHVFI